MRDMEISKTRTWIGCPNPADCKYIFRNSAKKARKKKNNRHLIMFIRVVISNVLNLTPSMLCVKVTYRQMAFSCLLI